MRNDIKYELVLEETRNVCGVLYLEGVYYTIDGEQIEPIDDREIDMHYLTIKNAIYEHSKKLKLKEKIC